MKIVSIDRELNTDQIYIYIIIALKIYNKNYKKGEYFAEKKTIKKIIQKMFS